MYTTVFPLLVNLSNGMGNPPTSTLCMVLESYPKDLQGETCSLPFRKVLESFLGEPHYKIAHMCNCSYDIQYRQGAT